MIFEIKPVLVSLQSAFSYMAGDVISGNHPRRIRFEFDDLSGKPVLCHFGFERETARGFVGARLVAANDDTG